MKGAIQDDHMPVNKFTLSVIGLPDLTVTEMSGIEEELNTVDLPDRTRATGGQKPPTEHTFMIPMHHAAEVAACESWYKEGQDPVSPTYKKVGTLTHLSLTGAALKSYTLIGIFISKRKLPDLEMENEGDMAAIEWTVSVDDLLPI